jgi:hypothetical protein
VAETVAPTPAVVKTLPPFGRAPTAIPSLPTLQPSSIVAPVSSIPTAACVCGAGSSKSRKGKKKKSKKMKGEGDVSASYGDDDTYVDNCICDDISNNISNNKGSNKGSKKKKNGKGEAGVRGGDMTYIRNPQVNHALHNLGTPLH